MIDFFTTQIEDICSSLIPKSINGIGIIYSVNVLTYTELDVDTNKPIHYFDINIDITHEHRSLLTLGLFDKRAGYCTELSELTDSRKRTKIKNKIRRSLKDAISENNRNYQLHTE